MWPNHNITVTSALTLSLVNDKDLVEIDEFACALEAEQANIPRFLSITEVTTLADKAQQIFDHQLGAIWAIKNKANKILGIISLYDVNQQTRRGFIKSNFLKTIPCEQHTAILDCLGNFLFTQWDFFQIEVQLLFSATNKTTEALKNSGFVQRAILRDYFKISEKSYQSVVHFSKLASGEMK